MELTKNGINGTNIKKDFRIIQIVKSFKCLVGKAKQAYLALKTALQTFAGKNDFF